MVCLGGTATPDTQTGLRTSLPLKRFGYTWTVQLASLTLEVNGFS